MDIRCARVKLKCGMDTGGLPYGWLFQRQTY